jgi:hypothetical protein
MHGLAVVKLEAAEFFGGVMREYLPRRREDEEEALFGSMTSFAHERHGRHGSN